MQQKNQECVTGVPLGHTLPLTPAIGENIPLEKLRRDLARKLNSFRDPSNRLEASQVLIKLHYRPNLAPLLFTNAISSTVQEMITHKLHVNIPNNHGSTLLHFASKFGTLQDVKKLIDYKANVNAENLKKRTPIYYACSRNSIKIVDLLLKNVGETPLPRQDAINLLSLICDKRKLSFHTLQALLCVFHPEAYLQKLIKANEIGKEQLEKLLTLFLEIPLYPQAFKILMPDTPNLLNTTNLLAQIIKNKLEVSPQSTKNQSKLSIII